MKCALTNCDHEALWQFQTDGATTHLCDKHYRVMSEEIVRKVYKAEAGTVFGRAMEAQYRSKDLNLLAQPNPEQTAPNVSIAIAQATLAAANVFRKHNLTNVQQAVAANGMARVLIEVASQAHRDATLNN